MLRVRFFVLVFSVRWESPLVHYDRTWIKTLFSCILSCLFGLDLHKIASFNRASGIISESIPYSFFAVPSRTIKSFGKFVYEYINLNPPPPGLAFKAICYLHGGCAPWVLVLHSSHYLHVFKKKKRKKRKKKEKVVQSHLS